MASRFRHAALVGKYQAQGIRAELAEIAHFLLRQGLEVSLESQTALNTGITGFGALTPEQLGRECDLAVVVGGDGTMLGIARQLSHFGTPLVGINQGRLGFITDVNVGQFAEVLAPMLAGDYEEERRTMLEGTVWRDAAMIFDGFALNDVVVSRGSVGGMIELTVTIDGRFVYNQRADGLIIATPTGSTAYSLSANGPILHPNLAAIVLVPISPHALTNRPIALSNDCTVELMLTRGRDAGAHFDGQAHFMLVEHDSVTVRRSEHRIRFLHPKGYDYFRMLREKLHWSALPTDNR